MVAETGGTLPRPNLRRPWPGAWLTLAPFKRSVAMNELLLRGGQLAGAAGILLMVIAGVARLSGRFALGGFGTGTLLLAGIGAVGVGCFLLLWLLAGRTRG
jgi:hypothetical protein